MLVYVSLFSLVRDETEKRRLFSDHRGFWMLWDCVYIINWCILVQGLTKHLWVLNNLFVMNDNEWIDSRKSLKIWEICWRCCRHLLHWMGCYSRWSISCQHLGGADSQFYLCPVVSVPACCESHGFTHWSRWEWPELPYCSVFTSDPLPPRMAGWSSGYGP